MSKIKDEAYKKYKDFVYSCKIPPKTKVGQSIRKEMMKTIRKDQARLDKILPGPTKDIGLTGEQRRFLEKAPGIFCGTDKLGYYLMARGKNKAELMANAYEALKLIQSNKLPTPTGNIDKETGEIV